MNRKIKSYLLLIGLLIILVIIDVVMICIKGGLFSIFSPKSEEKVQPFEEKLSEITINQKVNGRYVIGINESFQLTIKGNTNDKNLSEWNYDWLSSNSNIVTVSTAGKIFGKSFGEAVIRVTNKNDVNIYDLVTIQVIDKNNRLSFLPEYPETLEVVLGEIKKLNLIVGGNVAQNQLIWESNNQEVLTIKDGYIYAHKVGTAVVSVKSSISSEYTDTILIRVYNVKEVVNPPTEIKINHLYLNKKEILIEDLSEIPFYLNDELVINASTNNATNMMVNFEPLDDNIILKSAESYIATFGCAKEGTAKIKISSKYNHLVYQEIEINIYRIAPVSRISISSPVLTNTEKGLSYSMKINEVVKLVVLGDQTNLIYSDYLATSSNEQVAIVDENYLIALNTGTTVITIKDKYNQANEISFTLEVTNEKVHQNIEHIFVEDIQLNNQPTTINMDTDNQVYIGNHLTLDVFLSPYDLTLANGYHIYSTDEKVADVMVSGSGYNYHLNIDFKKTGKVSIIIKFFDKTIETLKLDFKVLNTEFNFDAKAALEMTKGKTYQIYPSITNSLTDDIDIHYTSSDPNILSIGPNGDILAIEEGKAIITATATDGITTKTKELTITVSQILIQYQPVTAMTYKTYINQNGTLVPIDLNETAINVYQKIQLSVAVSPNYNNANNYQVSSSDSKIIAVDYINYMYQLTALTSGTATITITNYENDELTASFTIKVCEILPKYMVAELEKGEILLSETTKFDLLIDRNATYSKVDYAFSKPGVIEIRNNTIIPVHPGTTTVIMRVNDGDEETADYYFTFPITVLNVKEKTIFDFNKTEILAYFIFHIVVFMLLGGYATYLIKKLRLKKEILIILLIIIPLVISILPELVKLSSTGGIIFLSSLFINVITFIIGELAVIIYPKFKKEKAHEE